MGALPISATALREGVARLGLASSSKQQVIGQEEITSICTNDLNLNSRFKLDIRKNTLKRIAEHWNRLLREVAESPETFTKCVDVPLRDIILWWTWQCWINAWT